MLPSSSSSLLHGAGLYGAGPQGERALPQLSAAGGLESARTQAMEFEAVFLTSMLAPMFETVGEDAFGGGAGASTWRSMLVEEYANGIARAGGVGIADQVMNEIVALQEASRTGK